MGGGFLRTGCGPGPLEPDLDNLKGGPSHGPPKPPQREGNTAGDTAAPLEWERPFLFMKITVNGKPVDLEPGTTVEGLLAFLGVPRQYTAVAVNRDITPKSEYGAVKLGEGDRVEIVRPMGGGI